MRLASLTAALLFVCVAFVRELPEQVVGANRIRTDGENVKVSNSRNVELPVPGKK